MRQWRSARARRELAVLAAVLALVCTACWGEGGEGDGSGGSRSGDRPNVVFVLTDDLSTDLVRYMPHVKEMRDEGMSFANYTVTDSLCCPSRSSIFTGKYPHNTGVFTNEPPDGGFGVFHGRRNEQHTFATALRKRGYRTAMMGKYLNGYQPGMTVGGEKNYVPPGWDDWRVAGNGYPEYDYTLNENGKTVRYGKKPEDYLTDVVGAKGLDFVSEAVKDDKPFALDISTFAPHSPATPAPQDRGKFPDAPLPRPPSFNRLPANAPQWLKDQKPLAGKAQQRITRMHRKRIRSVQAVDRMVGDLRERLEKEGVLDETVFVFASDNGFHMGQYRLNPGKQTAFDTDVNVPLVVTGPGVQKGRTSREVVSNIDLAPTFTDLGGCKPEAGVDGRSIVPLLKGETPEDWPEAALVEHHGPNTSARDPDRPARGSGNPPTYQAVRTARTTYVEYADGAREFYDRRKDPHQLRNVYGQLPAETRRKLDARAAALSECRGAKECAAAAGRS